MVYLQRGKSVLWYFVLQVQKVCRPPAGWQEVLSGLSDVAAARRTWSPRVSQNQACHSSWAEEAQRASAPSGQQEEQRAVPVHRPQLTLPAGHTGCSGIQEGVVCGHAQVRKVLVDFFNMENLKKEIFPFNLVKWAFCTFILGRNYKRISFQTQESPSIFFTMITENMLTTVTLFTCKEMETSAPDNVHTYCNL